MNRDTFYLIYRERLKDTRTLLKNNNFSGAYYMAGYIIECALKVCIAQNTKRYDFPNKQIVNDSYTHELKKLINVSGLKNELDKKIKADKNFEKNWTIAKDWKTNSRYEIKLKSEAVDMYYALVNRKHGVLKWIKSFWI